MHEKWEKDQILGLLEHKYFMDCQDVAITLDGVNEKQNNLLTEIQKLNSSVRPSNKIKKERQSTK